MLEIPIQDAMATEITLVGKHESLHSTIQKMALANIGAVVVMEEGKPIGIFTERDLLKRVVAKDINIIKTSVSQVMTPKIVSVAPDTKVREVIQKMYTYAMRHMLIMDGEKLLGSFSLRDLLRRLLTN